MVNKVNLNEYGLGNLGLYKFLEPDESTKNSKKFNLEKNPDLLAVKTSKLGEKELVILDKKLLTRGNKIKAIFGAGPLAHIDYHFFAVGKFVEEKVKALCEAARKEMQDPTNRGRKSFEEMAVTFQGDRKDEILENIYAIANRMKLSASFRDDSLFNMVSESVNPAPRILKGVADLTSRIKNFKYNPGYNGRFLALDLKAMLGLSRNPTAIVKAKEDGYRSPKQTRGLAVDPVAQAYANALKDLEKHDPEVKKISLAQKIIREEISKIIVAFDS